jgi:acyl carrier protein
VDELLSGDAPEELVGSTYLVEEEILDSLGIISMVTFLETRFGITIDAEDVTLDNFESLDAVSAFVRAQLEPGRVD